MSDRPPIAESLVMRRVLATVGRAASSDVAVLVLGESGAGKEVVARALHEAGPRRRAPFVAASCAEIPDGLAESALFGHGAGAFTGAHRAAPGLFVAADGGTLFLDELGEASPALQAKLLRAVETGEIRPLGTTPRRVNVRIVTATAQDLRARVRAGSFRADLWQRLAGLVVVVPPLRERREDVVPLAERFLAELARAGEPPRRLNPGCVEALLAHGWPGNARELRNALARAVALGGDPLSESDLGLDPDPPAMRGPGTVRLADVERDAIERALASAGGHVRKAARQLGIHPATLYRRLARREARETGPSGGR